ncbi:hypothetical protein [Geodermatophilus sp. URMC 60]
MTPAWVLTIIGGLIGGFFGISGTLLGAWIAGRRARREREQETRQAILRVLPKLRIALTHEAAKRDADYAELQAATATVDELSGELFALVGGLSKKLRDDAFILIDALDERWSLDLSPDIAGRRVLYALKEIVAAKERKRVPASWVSQALSELAADVAEIRSDREESFRAQDEEERAELERRTAEGPK